MFFASLLESILCSDWKNFLLVFFISLIKLYMVTTRFVIICPHFDILLTWFFITTYIFLNNCSFDTSVFSENSSFGFKLVLVSYSFKLTLLFWDKFYEYLLDKVYLHSWNILIYFLIVRLRSFNLNNHIKPWILIY